MTVASIFLTLSLVAIILLVMGLRDKDYIMDSEGLHLLVLILNMWTVVRSAVILFGG